MSDENAIPSQDPADTGTLPGVLRAAFRKLMQSTDGMLPARVVAVSPDRKFVKVQPCIHVIATDGTATERGDVARVPVLWMGAGNFVMSFPLKAGDFGWLIAGDRDQSLYVQAGGPARPGTDRLHSFSDGVFIPEKAREWTLSGDDADAAVWQSLDGSIKIALSDAKLSITHPIKIELVAPLITASQDIQVAGRVTAAQATIGGKNFLTHTHTGVTAGGANTGVPT